MPQLQISGKDSAHSGKKHGSGQTVRCRPAAGGPDPARSGTHEAAYQSGLSVHSRAGYFLAGRPEKPTDTARSVYRRPVGGSAGGRIGRTEMIFVYYRQQ